MIQLFKRQNRLERQRLRALAAGELHDVTREARELGFSETVCISNRLWTSLMRPYPFAEPNDCVSLPTLLRALKQRLHAPLTSDAGMLLLLPSDLPDWFRGPCYLRFLVNPSSAGTNSIIVRPLSEQFYRCPEHREHSLPATLLIRLAETVRTLTFVSPAAEHGLVDSMQRLINELIQPNPFHREIAAFVAAIAPDPSLPFAREDFRSVLLADLDELLAVLDQCANAKLLPKVEALKSHYRALLSPLAAFRAMLEELLRLIAAAPSHYPTLQGQGFAHLLNLYADINTRHKRLETQVPPDTFAVVRFHLRLLAQILVAAQPDFLADMERAFASLLSNKWSQSTHGPSHECRHAVVWH
jgi:hypothetical protein